jgi:two-component system NtrC family sensor kinase
MYFYQRYEPYEDDRPSWLLVIEASRDEVFAPITRLRQYILIMMAALLVMSLFMARWVAARLARPVQMLAQGITRYADGETDIRCTQTRSDEIGVAGRAFNYLCETLEHTRGERDKAETAVRQSERLAAVGQMAAGIAHEINNPLMNIMSLASLVEKSVGDINNPEVKQDLQTLREEGQRCARIVQGILKFARASEPSITSINLVAIMKDTLNLLKHRFDAAGLQVETDMPDELYIQGDADQLQQVLVNILLNAVHASPSDSLIQVCLRHDATRASIEIRDQGDGIPAEELSRVFNPFYSTKPEGQGTGLGLSVSYGIIQKHRGAITIDSVVGQGTLVRIVLPVDMSDQVDNNNTSDTDYTARGVKVAGS